MCQTEESIEVQGSHGQLSDLIMSSRTISSTPHTIPAVRQIDADPDGVME
jgi:hypothetical protein